MRRRLVLALVMAVFFLVLVDLIAPTQYSTPATTSAQTTSSTCDQIYNAYKGPAKMHANGYFTQFNVVGDAAEFNHWVNGYPQGFILYYGIVRTPAGVGFDYSGNPVGVQALWFSDNGIATIYLCN